jgi:hypothetical protein
MDDGKIIQKPVDAQTEAQLTQRPAGALRPAAMKLTEASQPFVMALRSTQKQISDALRPATDRLVEASQPFITAFRAAPRQVSDAFRKAAFELSGVPRDVTAFFMPQYGRSAFHRLLNMRDRTEELSRISSADELPPRNKPAELASHKTPLPEALRLPLQTVEDPTTGKTYVCDVYLTKRQHGKFPPDLFFWISVTLPNAAKPAHYIHGLLRYEGYDQNVSPDMNGDAVSVSIIQWKPPNETATAKLIGRFQGLSSIVRGKGAEQKNRDERMVAKLGKVPHALHLDEALRQAKEYKGRVKLDLDSINWLLSHAKEDTPFVYSEPLQLR